MHTFPFTKSQIMLKGSVGDEKCELFDLEIAVIKVVDSDQTSGQTMT